MKKLLNIAITSIIAIALIVMASGVTFRHCSCSGKTTILAGNLADTEIHTSKADRCKSSCKGYKPISKGCMTVSSVSLSPTTIAHPMAFDFHVFQPLVAIINNWHIGNLAPHFVEAAKLVLPLETYSPPPRQYLHILRVLTI